MQTEVHPYSQERELALNQNKRYYTSTPDMLRAYAKMVPPVDEQK